ncbi:hypothetical protein GGI25_005281 [Coemansia spiralis]|uniref:Major facilitator superfamily (MFS) profile domain-containing protein n=2 Tax=Coemansia TaxID=4863 RepID=A0A9W8FYX5_9FUNG|nr:hypothetical protein EDC05_005290 [Coemansia umbellata]KAJ2619745.1 hypothetical protein GGI26_005599 [Coemansia sp. RSA 1358]KAJ2672041.1 hypothetical protein GGI25_005281 [Coemansia spiralis]
MVQEFGVAKSHKDVAFYASLLFTSFSLCQALTIMYWGRLSDRIGRRPVLLIGLVGNLISYLVFGLSRSFWVALAARSFNGLLAGDVAVVKSAVAEISDETNRARIMGFIPLTWNIGAIAGASIGGMLADPAHQYPSIFGNVKFFVNFPYFLPCAMGCSVTLIGLTFCIFEFEETLVRKELQSIPSNAVLSSGNNPSATLSSEGTPLLVTGQEAQTVQSPAQRQVKELLTPMVVRVLTTNFCICFAMTMGEQIYPVFAASPTSDGGLGFKSRSIGFSLAISAMAVFYMQLVGYPQLERKYGVLYCYQQGQALLVPIYLALPLLSLLSAHIEKATNSTHFSNFAQPLSSWDPSILFEYATMWILLSSLLLVQTAAKILASTSINLLTVNVAPSKTELGFMNGAQQMGVTIARVISPLISSFLWTWSIKHPYLYPFNSHLAWVVTSILVLISYLQSRKLPVSLNRFAADNNNSDSEPSSSN